MQAHTARLTVALAAVLLGLGACGNDDASPPPTGDAVDGTTVEIEGFAFPDAIRVGTGESIRIVNRDSAAHTFSTADGTLAEQVAGGSEVTITAPDPGTYEVFCAFHPAMQSTLEVTP